MLFNRNKKSTNKVKYLAANTITVNSFFAGWIKSINIKRYGDDFQILPLSNPINLYKYPDPMLKDMPKGALKTHEKDN